MVRFKPQSGFDSEYTQALANHFPPWHRIRFDPTSTGQDFLNTYAMGISEINQYLKYTRRNLYIGTADTLVRTHAYHCELPQKIALRKSRGINLLRNASFRDLGQAWRNQPLEWQVSNGEFYQADSYIGNGSIQLQPSGEFWQIVSGEDFRKGQSYTAGIWVKSNETADDPNGAIILEATGWGWSQSGSSTFPLNTTGEWVHETITIVPTGDIRTLSMKVQSNTTGDYNVLFSGPMMQEGDSLNEWEPGKDLGESLFRAYLAGPTGETQEHIELKEVFDEYDFFEDALPSRIIASPYITGDLISDNYAPVEYEWTKDFWDCEFRISGDYIEKYSTRLTGDVWHTYSILDDYMDNEVNSGEYGYATEDPNFSRTLEALCVWRHRIYLISKDTYGGTTHRVLKILRWQGIDDRLETQCEARVGMDTGDVLSIGFIEGRMDQMGLVMSDASEWTLQFYYDIFLYDGDRRQVLLRHPYTNYTLMFSEL